MRYAGVLACIASAAVLAQPAEVRLRAPRLIDGAGRVVENATVVVRGATIAAVETGPAQAADIDLGRATLLPGLIDVHVHIGWHFGPDGRLRTRSPSAAQDALHAAENAYLTLMAGVTTIQSPGQLVDMDLRDAVARGVLPGPRILTSIGQITPESGTPAELRGVVRDLRKRGADVVKIIGAYPKGDVEANMSREQFAALCGEAKAQGMRTMVHAQTTATIRAALDAGCGQIDHGTQVDETGLKLMAERGVCFAPNVGVVMQNYLRNRQKFLGVAGYTAESFASMERAIVMNAAMIRKAVATPGLRLVMASDAVAGAHGRNADELVERVRQGGQDPMAAITSATSVAAECLNLGREIGRLAPGYRADIIAVEGDPSKDVTALTRVAFVMRDGRIYKR